ncbi:hypothetical protein [Micromonospora pallida]|uniref:hypothetical protein n=1 Tax=Micromonospora pallida TaxID=145854 RepID=UPI00159F0AD6|nr:hypothetical protein [Micromonospora pallida]
MSSTTAPQRLGGQWPEPVRQQTDGLDQRDVVLLPIGGEQRQPDSGRASISAVPHQPPPGLPHPLPVRTQRRCSDVLVVMDRDVDIMERANEFARRRIGLAEVHVEDGGHVGTLEPLIFPGPRSLPPTVEFVGRGW